MDIAEVGGSPGSDLHSDTIYLDRRYFYDYVLVMLGYQPLVVGKSRVKAKTVADTDYFLSRN